MPDVTPDELKLICEAYYGYGWQSKLAHDLGVDARTVRHWAAGTRKISEPISRFIRLLTSNPTG